MSENNILEWFADVNFALMNFIDPGYFFTFSSLIFIGALISMTPLRYDINHQFATVIAIYVRKSILWLTALLLLLPLAMYYVYEMTMQYEIGNAGAEFASWFSEVTGAHVWMLPAALASGWLLRFTKQRYLIPLVSKLQRQLRFKQTNDELSDIQDELERYKEKDYDPQEYYDLDDKIFIALDEENNPIYVPRSTWVEVNMQIIGPTRYGKGVEAGVLADQGIRFGDSVFYIAPKKEKFMPHIMHEAAKAKGRKFYYVDLTDDGPGKWGPFLGGTQRDALSRLYNAVGLELTGNPGTDFYKIQERKELINAFERGRSLKAMLQNIDEDSASKVHASISEWTTIDTYNCKAGQGFSIEKALKEDAVVYIQGALTDPVVKMMMKIMIIELVQEAARLEESRSKHLTVFVDEVRFLVSKQLADALATIVGFDVNFILMYQSILDLTAPDDTTLNGKALLQSVNVNSQLKAIYGGADPETADWIADLSGEKTLNVAKLERTEILDGGGEVYNDGRMLGTEQVSLIHSNVVKVLPPKICALFQPREVAKIAYTSWVRVSSNTPLNEYLDSLNKRKAAINLTKNEQTKKEESKKQDKTKHIESAAEELKLLEVPFKGKNTQKVPAQTSLTPQNKEAEQKAQKRKERKKKQRLKAAESRTPKVIEPFSLDGDFSMGDELRNDDTKLLSSLSEEDF